MANRSVKWAHGRHKQPGHHGATPTDMLPDRGKPSCAACGDVLTFGTDHDGRLMEFCRCGDRMVQTTGFCRKAVERVRQPPPPQAGRNLWGQGLYRSEQE